MFANIHTPVKQRPKTIHSPAGLAVTAAAVIVPSATPILLPEPPVKKRRFLSLFSRPKSSRKWSPWSGPRAVPYAALLVDAKDDAVSIKTKSSASTSKPVEDPRPPFEFHGTKGAEEVRELVRTVWKFARAKSMESDAGWKVRFAGYCMQGQAEEWWKGLDPAIKADWELFREELYIRFPTVRDGRYVSALYAPMASFNSQT